MEQFTMKTLLQRSLQRLQKQLNLSIWFIIFSSLCLGVSAFAQDLNPSHNAYNSLTSVVDAMKLERTSCAEIGYYPQLGQSICANVPAAENFRTDWDLIVSRTGPSFGLSPLGDWTSEPARGVIHRTYLLGSTDLKVNYDVISSRITIDVLDPELQAQEEARRQAQAQAEAAQAQQAQAQAAQTSPAQATQNQVTNTHTAQSQATQQTSHTTMQQPTTVNGFVATNTDGTTFVLAENTTTVTVPQQVVTTPQIVTTQTTAQNTTAQQTNYAATATTTVDNRAYAPATQPVSTQTTSAQTASTQNSYEVVQPTQLTQAPDPVSGYPTTAATNYGQTGQTNYGQTNYQAVTAQTSAQQTVQSSQTTATNTTSNYAYTPTNLVTAMGTSVQNTEAFQPNGAWQITNSGNAVTIDLYDTTTQSYLRTVYPDQVYNDAGNFYLSINGNAAWAISVWTE